MAMRSFIPTLVSLLISETSCARIASLRLIEQLFASPPSTFESQNDGSLTMTDLIQLKFRGDYVPDHTSVVMKVDLPKTILVLTPAPHESSILIHI